jgi:hypothetical protein
MGEINHFAMETKIPRDSYLRKIPRMTSEGAS